MPNPRLQLALEQLPASDWEFFEHFAAEFLVIDYPSLRTTASPHGDLGRDGELFEIDGVPTQMVQYSVTTGWKAKIEQTLERLSTTKPETKVLIYVSPQRIGADADDLKRTLRSKGMTLDVLDRSYFVERELTHPQRRAAAEEIIERILGPLLRERRVIEHVAEPLASDEAKIAVVHLALDASDEASQKSLTKQCFESLVLAALHETDADHVKPLADVVAEVQSLLPLEEYQRVEGQTASALVRLSRKRGPVKHNAGAGGYHLAFEEQQRLAERSAEFVSSQNALGVELVGALSEEVVAGLGEDERFALGGAMRTAMEALLLDRGERFASALASDGDLEALSDDELHVVEGALQRQKATSVGTDDAADAIMRVLRAPSKEAHAHLQSLSDAYTMFAFLRQTADVQSVANRLFSDGEIWLDTNFVLPLLAETLEYEANRRPYTTIFEAAQESGMSFYVTAGVIEEIETHIVRARSYAVGQSGPWRGTIPFLFVLYMASGEPRESFSAWVEQFRTDSRPLEDVEEYLDEVLQIKRRDLADLADTAPDDVRRTVQEVWAEAHDRRRAAGKTNIDQATMLRLVSHDVENTVGIIQLRKEKPASSLGYRHWWLTLDSVALRLNRALREELGRLAPQSPALDPRYLVRVLRMNAQRAKVTPELRANLPLLSEFRLRERAAQKVVRVAEEVRRQNAGKDERVIRHLVRDKMDEIRTLNGRNEQRPLKASDLTTAVLDELDLEDFS